MELFRTNASASGVRVTVNTEYGTLRGQEKVSKFFPDKKYYSFQNILYAKRPFGSLRFKDPEELEPWSGVGDAVGKRVTITQRTFYHDMFYAPTVPTEDCLYLDVDTPQIDESRKPVIVWIHPMWLTRDSDYSPQCLGVGHYMAEDVIFVTVQYRYNVLGFLCLDHEEVPGNAGLKDQVMALKWVQRNISKFGGDPNNVTLYGFGPAAVFAHYHLMSPLSAGLFHRVIIQGDCALNPHAYVSREVAIERAFRLGKALGCTTDNDGDLLQFLRTVYIKDLLTTARYALDDVETLFHFGIQFVPCVEVPATEKTFLPLPPRQLLKLGLFAKVPTVIGVSMNGIFPRANSMTNMEYMADSVESGGWANKIRNFYFANKPKNQLPYICGQLDHDFSYLIGFDEAVRMQLEHAEDPVYVLDIVLGYLSPLDEFSYSYNIKACGEDGKYNLLSRMWSSFAKTSNPNNTSLTLTEEEVTLTWEPARKDSFCYLQVTCFVQQINGRVGGDRTKMWQQVFEKYPDIREQYSLVYRSIHQQDEPYLEPGVQLLFNSDD